MHQPGAEFGDLGGQHLGCERVEGVRQIGVTFSLVDGGVGGGVDDHIRAHIAHGLRQAN